MDGWAFSGAPSQPDRMTDCCMEIIRYVAGDGGTRVGVRRDGVVHRLAVPTIAELLSRDLAHVVAVVGESEEAETDPVRLLAPVDGATEVWAAGVTYRRSRDARIEESSEADVYDRVYRARRPELFFKSLAWRVSGPDEAVAIRDDSTLDVPEPELALVLTASGEIAGYSACNDMSSRSIEGENPLYLPQAKVYAGACALGPGIRLAPDGPDPTALGITMEIRRGGAVAWRGATNTDQVARPFADLVEWLYRGQPFPAGAVLSTGTGIVPDLGFSLRDGDEVTVHVDGVGTLVNPVVRGRDAMAWLVDRARLL
jgi:2-dehydro-3-deoxy-D-arabinonate dehydratase